MNVDPQNPEIQESAMPELSRTAWQEMLSGLSASAQSESANRDLACVSTPKFWQNLRLTKLAGSENLLSLQDDSWVFRYEQIQEMLAHRLRKTGEPQNGVFYTPPAVASYLVERTLGVFLQEVLRKVQMALQVKNLALAIAEWKAAQSARVIDPACGTGVFLVEAFKCFHRFYLEISALSPEFNLENPAHYIIKHHLAGIDLDPLSVMITEFRLVQLATRLDKMHAPQVVAFLPFYVGDTLQENPCPVWMNDEASGNSAELGQWQFILGNPPYLTEVRGHAQRFRQLQQRSRYYQPKMDLCDGFLAWALDHVSPDGQVAYVLPSYWTQRSSTASLRAKLWAEGQLQELWHFAEGSLFKNAPGHHTALVIWKKNTETLTTPNSPTSADLTQPDQVLSAFQHIYYGKGNDKADLNARNLQTYSAFWQAGGYKILMGDPSEVGLLAQLSALPPLLKAVEIQQGLVIPQGRLKASDRVRLAELESGAFRGGFSDEPGVFVLNEQELSALRLTDEELSVLRPYYRPAGFQAFQGFPHPEPTERIIYTDLHHRRLLEQYPQRFARLRKHLDRFGAVNTSAFAPYGLHRARQPEWFEDERKIFVPRQIAAPAFAVVPFPAYVNEGFLSIRSYEDADWLCAVLNSYLAWFWLYHQKRKGLRLQIDKEVLCQFPQPVAATDEIRLACQTLAKKLSEPEQRQVERLAWQRELNTLIYQAYALTPSQIHVVKRLVAELETPLGRKGKP